MPTTATMTRWAAALAVTTLSGCYQGLGQMPEGATAGADGADSGAEGGEDAGEDGEALGCEGEGSVTPLRRLSEVQYRNTLADLMAPAGLDLTVEIASDLERIPADDAGSTFGILDSRVSEMHVGAFYRIADGLSYAVIGDQDTLSAVVGSCAVGQRPDPACIDAFVDDFAMRAYRRPLDEQERARLHAIADDSEDAVEASRALVFAVLMSPQFLYHVEVAGEGDDDEFMLGPYEVASRLSYHFWQTMPDDALFAAAADGSLTTDEGYAEQLQRVFEDPRTQATIDRFYDEWLQLGWLTQFPSTPAFETFAEGTTIGDPEADHIAASREEIHALTRYYTWQTDGSLTDILLSDRNFTTSPHLAAVYGVEPWDGQSEPPAMPQGERAGILTRTAFLLTGDHETHPIYRGASVRRRIMCEELPSPDPTALPDGALDPPPVTDDQTTRERYEAKTASAECVSCHGLINPVGFVLERYDAVGRYRSEEQVIDEVTGEVIASLPIDSQATLSIGGDSVDIDSGPQLAEQIAASGKVEACFARQYFRATFGREQTEADTCTVDAVADTLLDGGSMKDALLQIAQTATFRSRRVQ